MTQTSSQGTSSESVLFDGFRPQIHPPVITAALHAKSITAAQLSGFFKGSIFIQYKLTGSSLLGTYYATTPDRLVFYSGFRCTLIRPFLLHSAVVN